MPGGRGAIRSAACRVPVSRRCSVCVAVLAWAAPASATPVFLSPIDVSDAGEDASSSR